MPVFATVGGETPWGVTAAYCGGLVYTATIFGFSESEGPGTGSAEFGTFNLDTGEYRIVNAGNALLKGADGATCLR